LVGGWKGEKRIKTKWSLVKTMREKRGERVWGGGGVRLVSSCERLSFVLGPRRGRGGVKGSEPLKRGGGRLRDGGGANRR